jgi:plastocyanin
MVTKQWIALVTLAAGIVACSSDSNTGTVGGSTNVVQATAGLAFTPAVISIHPGDSVTWQFASVGHNVTFDAVTGVPASILGTNANVNITRTFANAGTYTYHCTIHPSMTGTVTVTASDVSSPPPAPPPPPPAGYLRHPAA